MSTSNYALPNTITLDYLAFHTITDYKTPPIKCKVIFPALCRPVARQDQYIYDSDTHAAFKTNLNPMQHEKAQRIYISTTTIFKYFRV